SGVLLQNDAKVPAQFSVGTRSMESITIISICSFCASSLNPNKFRMEVKMLALPAGTLAPASATLESVAPLGADDPTFSKEGSGAQERSMSYVPLMPVRSCMGSPSLVERRRASVAMVMDPLIVADAPKAKANATWPVRARVAGELWSDSLNFVPFLSTIRE